MIQSSVAGAKPALLTFAAIAAAMTTTTAQTTTEQAPPPRPKYQLLHQNENWSFLANPQWRSDWWDPIKYVPLSDDGEVWVSFGGDAQVRTENWNNFNFGAPSGVSHDDDFTLSRALVHADLHWGDDLRFYGELKTAQSTSRDLPGGRRPLDMDTFALQQLFLDYKWDLEEKNSLTLRPGRQMIAFGANRLISPLPWGNTLRTWDGGTATLVDGPWKVTGVAAAFAPVDKTEFNDTDWDSLLYGIYATRSSGGPGDGGLDLYWLGTERDDASFNGTTGDSERQTLGARSFGPFAENFDRDVEASFQFGEVGSEDVCAWSFASQVGYKPGGGPSRYWLGLDWASGDDDPGGDVETFDQLYPLGHAFFGYMDVIGRQNIVDTSTGANWKLAPDIALSLGGHSFWIPTKHDAIYNAGGGITRAPGSFDSNWVGWELDAVVTWRPDPHVTTQLGLGHFFAGDALEDSGPSDDIDFAYVSVAYTF